jgi:selenide,water dikinase
VLRHLSPPQDPNLLSGFDGNSDAAVYRLTNELAIVQTVDYITPIVDDPESFGAIAAANALSDVYAMGARPVLALNLVGFPIKTLPAGVLQAILRGGQAKLAEAGVSLGGGHSIEDLEPKYGLAVTGVVHPQRIVTNKGARPGDVLILTKPLSTGIITTGIDRGLVLNSTVAQATALMTQLNRAAAEAMVAVGVHACTDVSGFGLLGHLHEMAEASGAAAEVVLARVPVLDEVWGLVAQGAVPDGSHNNHRFLANWTDWQNVPREQQLVLADAQTSGGLLIAVAPERKASLAEALAQSGVLAADIGHIASGPAGRITVRH